MGSKNHNKKAWQTNSENEAKEVEGVEESKTKAAAPTGDTSEQKSHADQKGSKLKHSFSNAWAGVKNLGEKAKNQGERVLDRVTDFVDEHPKLIGFTVGSIAVLGGIVKTILDSVGENNSNTSNDYMEETSSLDDSGEIVADCVSTQTPFIEELLEKYPPGDDPKKRKPNSVIAEKRHLSNHGMYEQAKKIGLMDENGSLTPTGQQYGEYRITQKGDPYVAWDPVVNNMINASQISEAKERKAQRIANKAAKEQSN